MLKKTSILAFSWLTFMLNHAQAEYFTIFNPLKIQQLQKESENHICLYYHKNTFEIIESIGEPKKSILKNQPNQNLDVWILVDKIDSINREKINIIASLFKKCKIFTYRSNGYSLLYDSSIKN